MPQAFKVDCWTVFFWANESRPLEPVHVHISRKRPKKNATKVWLTKAGGCVLANNNSRIPANELNGIMEIVAARRGEIVSMWSELFGEAKFYC